MIRRWLSACLALVLFWPSAAAAETLEGLYNRALKVSPVSYTHLTLPTKA